MSKIEAYLQYSHIHSSGMNQLGGMKSIQTITIKPRNTKGFKVWRYLIYNNKTINDDTTYSLNYLKLNMSENLIFILIHSFSHLKCYKS